jgi:benzoyl-CoA reductase subunit C
VRALSDALEAESIQRSRLVSTDQQFFDQWRGEDLDEVLYQCRNTIEEGDFSVVRAWRAQGGKVLGHFQVYFPQELAHAAGMLPIKLHGAPLEPTQADARFGSYLCSILKTSLELALKKEIELDMFISHPICDAARNLAAIWGRNFEYPSQILYLPQNANSKGSAPYLRDEYERLSGEIERVTGNKITEESLKKSIGIYNRSRALVRELYQIKRDTPWKISAEDAYCLVAIGGRIPVEEHVALLETALPMITARENKKEDRIRIVFEGAFCEQPPLDLVRMVGRTCYIVDDDFLIGLRWFTQDISTEGDGLTQLAESYLKHSSYSPVQHDDCKPKEKMLIERTRNAKAEAVIVSAAKMCEPGLEEQVAYLQALDEEKIPYFVSEFEENMTNFGSLEIQVETFVENLLFD